MNNQKMNVKETNIGKRNKRTIQIGGGILVIVAVAAAILFMTAAIDQSSFARLGSNVGFPNPDDPDSPECIVCGEVIGDPNSKINPGDIVIGPDVLKGHDVLNRAIR